MDGAQAILEPVKVPLWIELLAVFIAGMGGSLVAVRKGFDPAGVIAIALVSAMGGGIIRDVLIGRGTPAALTNPDYLYTACVAALVGLLFLRFVDRVNTWFIPIDAASLGLFTFVGMEKGLNFGLPVITAALLGVITATGGGLLRDVLAGEAPGVLRPGHLSMTAAIVGVGVYALLYWIGVPGYIDVWIIMAIVMSLRLASEYFGWSTPDASVVPGTVDAVGGKVGGAMGGAVGGAVRATPQRLMPSTDGPTSRAVKRASQAVFGRRAHRGELERPATPPSDARDVEAEATAAYRGRADVTH